MRMGAEWGHIHKIGNIGKQTHTHTLLIPTHPLDPLPPSLTSRPLHPPTPPPDLLHQLAASEDRLLPLLAIGCPAAAAAAGIPPVNLGVEGEGVCVGG